MRPSITFDVVGGVTSNFEQVVKGVEKIDEDVKRNISRIKEKLCIKSEICIHCKQLQQKCQFKVREILQKDQRIQKLKNQISKYKNMINSSYNLNIEPATHMINLSKESIESRIASVQKFQHLNHLEEQIIRQELEFKEIEERAKQLIQKDKLKSSYLKKFKHKSKPNISGVRMINSCVDAEIGDGSERQKISNQIDRINKAQNLPLHFSGQIQPKEKGSSIQQKLINNYLNKINLLNNEIEQMKRINDILVKENQHFRDKIKTLQQINTKYEQQKVNMHLKQNQIVQQYKQQIDNKNNELITKKRQSQELEVKVRLKQKQLISLIEKQENFEKERQKVKVNVNDEIKRIKQNHESQLIFLRSELADRELQLKQTEKLQHEMKDSIGKLNSDHNSQLMVLRNELADRELQLKQTEKLQHEMKDSIGKLNSDHNSQLMVLRNELADRELQLKQTEKLQHEMKDSIGKLNSDHNSQLMVLRNELADRELQLKQTEKLQHEMKDSIGKLNSDHNSQLMVLRNELADRELQLKQTEKLQHEMKDSIGKLNSDHNSQLMVLRNELADRELQLKQNEKVQNEMKKLFQKQKFHHDSELMQLQTELLQHKSQVLNQAQLPSAPSPFLKLYSNNLSLSLFSNIPQTHSLSSQPASQALSSSASNQISVQYPLQQKQSIMLSNALINKQLQLSQVLQQNNRLRQELSYYSCQIYQNKLFLKDVIDLLGLKIQHMQSLSSQISIRLQSFINKIENIQNNLSSLKQIMQMEVPLTNKQASLSPSQKMKKAEISLNKRQENIRYCEYLLAQKVLEYQTLKYQMKTIIQKKNSNLYELEEQLLNEQIQNSSKQMQILSLELDIKKQTQQMNFKDYILQIQQIKIKVLEQFSPKEQQYHKQIQKIQIQNTNEAQPLSQHQNTVNKAQQLQNRDKLKQREDQNKFFTVKSFQSLQKLQNQQLSYVYKMQEQIQKAQSNQCSQTKDQYFKRFNDLLFQFFGEKYNNTPFSYEIKNILKDLHMVDWSYYHLMKRCFDEQRTLYNSLSQHLQPSSQIFYSLKMYDQEDVPISQASQSQSNKSQRDIS